MISDLIYYIGPYFLFDLLDIFANALLEFLYAFYDLLPY